MSVGMQTVTNILQPKTRTSLALSGYSVTAVAKYVSTLTTHPQWAIYRMSLTTGDVDWAKGPNGNATDEFIFLGTDITNHDFDE